MNMKEYFENGGERVELTDDMKQAFQDLINHLKQQNQKPASK